MVPVLDMATQRVLRVRCSLHTSRYALARGPPHASSSTQPQGGASAERARGRRGGTARRVCRCGVRAGTGLSWDVTRRIGVLASAPSLPLSRDVYGIMPSARRFKSLRTGVACRVALTWPRPGRDTRALQRTRTGAEKKTSARCRTPLASFAKEISRATGPEKKENDHALYDPDRGR
jgi:hypothetical protein